MALEHSGTETSPRERVIRGFPASPGIVEGTLLDIRPESAAPTGTTTPDPEKEKERFLGAVERLLEKISRSQRVLSPDLRGLLVFEEGVLRDRNFRAQVLRLIDAGYPAERAISMTLEEYARPMEQAEMPVFQDRARELRALARLLAQEARSGLAIQLSPNQGNILVSDHLSVHEAIEVVNNGFQGVILTRGGKTSHPVLLLRDFRIPLLIQTEDFPEENVTGTPAILDARRGIVILWPSPQTRAQYREILKSWEHREAELLALREMETATKDGLVIHLLANVELPEEIPLLKRLGIRGVGLLRTEMLFHTHQGVDEQETFYRRVAQDMAPHPVTVRLFDLGGDKVLDLPQETNPFLGLRGIRVLLRAPELLETQIRAILRVHRETRNLRIMIPMVTSLEEVLAVKEVLHRLAQEEGVPENLIPQLGMMIETPASALMTETFARHVSFFSIGTNDLTQYVLAIDRTHPLLQSEFHHLHPAVIRLLWFTVKRAHRAGVWIGICGEMASDLEALPLLVALRVEELSMSPSVYLDAKGIVHSLQEEVTRALLEDVLQAETLSGVQQRIRAFYQEHLPEVADLVLINKEEPDGI